MELQDRLEFTELRKSRDESLNGRQKAGTFPRTLQQSTKTNSRSQRRSKPLQPLLQVPLHACNPLYNRQKLRKTLQNRAKKNERQQEVQM